MSYNGGAVIAMRGKGCVAIAADRRLGVRGHTVSMDFKKIFGMLVASVRIIELTFFGRNGSNPICRPSWTGYRHSDCS